MSDQLNCPICTMPEPLETRDGFECATCGHEWIDESLPEVKDANGNVLVDGNTVSVIKDLKVKGSSSVVKVGTRVKNIRLVDGDHNIDCKIDGIGAMKLKSEFVKKA